MGLLGHGIWVWAGFGLDLGWVMGQRFFSWVVYGPINSTKMGLGGSGSGSGLGHGHSKSWLGWVMGG